MLSEANATRLTDRADNCPVYETCEVSLASRHSPYSHAFLFGVAGTAQVIEIAVLGTDQQVADAVFVPADGGGAGVVTGEIGLAEVAHVLEKPFAIALADLLPELCVVAVDENVELAVAIPVSDAELAAS